MEFRDVDEFMFQLIFLCFIYGAGFFHGYDHRRAEANDG